MNWKSWTQRRKFALEDVVEDCFEHVRQLDEILRFERADLSTYAIFVTSQIWPYDTSEIMVNIKIKDDIHHRFALPLPVLPSGFFANPLVSVALFYLEKLLYFHFVAGRSLGATSYTR
jgi:hypothetical protein